MIYYEEIMKLALERGFYFPSCEIYADAPAGFWEYGPQGVNMKNKFIDLWRRELVRRDGMMEIDGAQIMSKSVFIASGHINNFTDPIVKCSKCKSIFRADRFITEKIGEDVHEGMTNEEMNAIIKKHDLKCANCNGELDAVKRFNMMFKVNIGPDQEEAYLRPETCQTIFVDFSRIFKTMRGKLPLGIAQIGKSFRNEIAPRQGLLRLREFYQAEIEVFCNPQKLNDLPRFEEIKNTILRLYDGTSSIELTADEGIRKGLLPNKLVAYYLALLNEFYAKTGIDMKRTRFRRLTNTEKAFYSTIAFDFEVETSTGWLELVACNYRSDYDLQGHASTSKQNLEVIDPSDQKKVLPHVFELSMGIDRSIFTILEHSYFEDKEHDDRIVLKLKPYLAPVLLGILPLMTKDGLREKAQKIYSELKREFDTFYDESGSIGRRYRRLEEIGTPYAVTVDKITMEDDTITVRYRDTMQQERIKISQLPLFLQTALFKNYR
ncbi:MAG TPA: glycine--tRNA ligase [Nitrososphaeraceae archaeon]|jgi:glycyl-tRNA synthetase|nr:glycine--tRNA ligase [Nitrososphaeraceae archaeon]